MIKNLIKKSRSYRRFDNSFSVPLDTLRELIDFARLSPSGANLQPLKFIISNSRETNTKIFPCLAWAGYLKDWDGPIEKERPSAYIIILVSCIANKVKFDWSGLEGELFRNLTCIPSVCALISGRSYAKRDQPYKAMAFQRPTTTKYNADDQHRLSYLAAFVHPEYNRQITPYLRYMTPGDKNIKNEFSCDCGIAAQSIFLGATGNGLGGCMIGSIQKNKLADVLNIDPQYEIQLVIALGKSVETVQIDEMKSADDVKYWRDEKNIHHVPKRSLDSIILK